MPTMQRSLSATLFDVCTFADRYTGKERDAESGLDYFDARMYASSMGRFMSPDPSGLLAANPADPQSWNMYAYARNKPLINIDPTGLDCVYANDAGNGVESIDHSSSSGECGGGGGTWAPGYVDESWAHFNNNTNMFQVGSVDGAGSGATVGQAETQYNNFVSASETQALNAQMQFWMADPDINLDNLSEASLDAFGEALHAVLDSTSPAHSGFQEWNWMNPFAVRRHINAEETISPQQMQNAVNAARNAYNATYGYLIGNMDTTSVSTSQGDGTPCGGKSGNPCPK